jgi:hypothetical protein
LELEIETCAARNHSDCYKTTDVNNLSKIMGKQHNKDEHKTRRKAYIKRKKVALKAKLKKVAPKAKA